DNFTMTGHESMGIDIDAKELLEVCLAENGRRMSGYDERLLRPKLVPRLARFARRFVRGAKSAA
ncbi:MAG TPA: ferritin-like domain-containing protein, partial [Alphaproteobacteria bacterium]|nr:ferritin-like domain-containing protein [Alphaproteobacteria bacterium]